MLGPLRACLVAATAALAAPDAPTGVAPGVGEAGTPDPAPQRDGAARPHLSVHLAGPSADTTAIERSLPDFLDELDATFGVERHEALDLEHVLATPTRAVAASAWIDTGPQGEVRVFIVDARAERIFIRTLAAVEPLDVVTVDEIGHVLFASFEALLSGATIGISRAEAAQQLLPLPEPARPEPARAPTSEPMAPEPAPPPSPTAGPSVAVLVGYGTAAAGPTAWLHGPLVAASLGKTLGRGRRPRADAARPGKTPGQGRVSGELDARAYVPVVADPDAPLSLRRSGGGLRLRPRVEFGLGPHISLGVEVGAGVDILHHRPVARGDAEAFGAFVRATGAADAGLGPQFELGRGRARALVRLLATIDVAWSRDRYRAADTGEVVFAPWIARPGARLLVGWGRRLTRASR